MEFWPHLGVELLGYIVYVLFRADIFREKSNNLLYHFCFIKERRIFYFLQKDQDSNTSYEKVTYPFYAKVFPLQNGARVVVTSHVCCGNLKRWYVQGS